MRGLIQRLGDASPVLLLQTQDIGLSVSELDDQGMTVAVDQRLMLEGIVRVGFQHDGKHPGYIVMATAAVSATSSDRRSELRLDFLALHSRGGFECIQEFLNSRMDIVDIPSSAFKAGAGGWFYRFPAEDKTSTDTTELPLVGAGTKRREPRVTVRVGVSVRHELGTHKARVYNVSYSGLFLSSEDVLPGMGDRLEVIYPIPVNGRQNEIYLTGHVVWSASGMSSAKGGGFGISVDNVEDGGNGKIWRRYVDHAASMG
jgi:hypothetical protein